MDDQRRKDAAPINHKRRHSMRMRQIVLICGLGAALVAGMAQAIEKQDGFQVIQVESVQALNLVDLPLVAQAEDVAAATAFRFETTIGKTASGVDEGASNTERMRQSVAAVKNEHFSIASVTSPAKAPEDPGKHFS